MKIKDSDLAALRVALGKVRDCHPTAERDYRIAGMSHMRYRWGMLNATGLKWQGDGRGMKEGFDLHLYAYLDDSHIDSALRSILGNEYSTESRTEVATEALRT